MLCCWGRHWIPGWKSLGSQLQERNRLMLLGRLVVLTWHSCLRLPLPPQRSVELRLLPIRGTGSQQESSHLSKGCEHPLGAHDWPESILGGDGHNPHPRASFRTEDSLPAPARVHSSHVSGTEITSFQRAGRGAGACELLPGGAEC